MECSDKKEVGYDNIDVQFSPHLSKRVHAEAPLVLFWNEMDKNRFCTHIVVSFSRSNVPNLFCNRTWGFYQYWS